MDSDPFAVQIDEPDLHPQKLFAEPAQAGGFGASSQIYRLQFKKHPFFWLEKQLEKV